MVLVLRLMRFVLSILVILTMTVGTWALSAGLDEYAWKNRPLIAFAASPSDVSLTHFRQLIASRECDVRDREIVVGELSMSTRSRIGGDILIPDEEIRLREQLRIEPSAFTVVLIGKDGGVKFKAKVNAENRLDLDEIFALIDGMPMRRREMAANPVNCG